MKTITTKRIILSASVSVIACMGSYTAHAAGFYIQEQSVSGLGNAYAGQVATPRDASIVYYNPAGMTKLSGSHVYAGTHILAPSANLKDTGSSAAFGGATGGKGGNPYSVTPIPNLHISHEVVENTFWLGLSVSAPFGLSNEYNEGWFGRFDSTETALQTIDFQPSFAVRVNDKLSVGGGMNIQHADVDIKKVINQGAGERNSTLEGDTTTFGFNVGVLYEPIEGTTLGAHYRSGIHHHVDGNVVIDNNGTVTSSTVASAELNLPEIIQLGVNHKVNDRLSLQAGATWFGWNSFEEIRVLNAAGGLIANTTQNYQTTWAFAVGGEYLLNDEWTLRAGYQFDETPTTDEYRTTLTPDGDRHWVSAGATYKYNDKIDIDLAATYVDIASEKIDVARNAGFATVKADTGGHVAIFSLGVNYKF